jgi:phosphohistidine phosphatase
MRTLTLLRHAKSSWSNPSLADHERSLNGRGERDAPIMGKRILEAGIRPSLIVSSPAIRAWTTARIVANEISYPTEFMHRESELYLARLNTLIDVVAKQDEGFHSIMLVCHNPGLTEFANYLCPGITNNLPTCGVVSVAFDSETWDLRGDGSVSLVIYDFPKNQA